MIQMGSWWVKSQSDPRWNKTGRGKVGSFMIPSGAEARINKCEKEFGVKPEDLEYGYMKD